MLVLLLLTLRVQQHGCKEGSRFEECEEYIQCLADLPNCVELVISPAASKPIPPRWTPSFNIIGTIPSAIGNLTALTTLAIGENGVSGTIPETIGLLTNLKSLRLASAPGPPPDASLLSGTLPPSLGNLTRLEHLLVYQTQISGTLHPSLGELTALQEISMFANAFTGVIPESIFELTALTELDLDTNHLSGTLSKNIGELTALALLSLSDNHLSGTVPDTFAALTSLMILYLQNNSFTAVGGGICAIQKNLEIACDLSDNEIPGAWNAKGGKTNCPVCLNSGKCDKHSQGPHSNQPIFPNKVCDFAHGGCTCWAVDPTTAPTVAPTQTAQENQWEDFKTAMCFGRDEHEAPDCFDVTFALLIGAVVGAVVFGVLYEFIVIPCHACRDSEQHGTPYKKALWYAFTHQCWRFTKRGREEERAHHKRESVLSHDSILSWVTAESTDSVQMGSTLAAPFLLDVATQGGEEEAGINYLSLGGFNTPSSKTIN